MKALAQDGHPRPRMTMLELRSSGSRVQLPVMAVPQASQALQKDFLNQDVLT